VGGAVVVVDLVEGEVDHEACVLFFDEFDSVARRRSDTPDQEWRRTVNQRLTSLEAHRDQDGPVVMAATNDIEQLDEAIIRPGRFGVWVDADRDPRFHAQRARRCYTDPAGGPAVVTSAGEPDPAAACLRSGRRQR
jgi:ATP-dependent 26S proteasome regulatory subunit